MNELKRYRPDWWWYEMDCDPDGEWIRYKDIPPFVSVAALKSWICRQRLIVEDGSHDGYKYHLQAGYIATGMEEVLNALDEWLKIQERGEDNNK